MHGKYASNKAVSECDVLFSIGTRFNDRITGDLNEFAPKAKIVHIDVDTAPYFRNKVMRSNRIGCKTCPEKLRNGQNQGYGCMAGEKLRHGAKRIHLRCAETAA